MIEGSGIWEGMVYSIGFYRGVDGLFSVGIIMYNKVVKNVYIYIKV